MMNYEQTLEKIHSYYAFGKKPGLSRIQELMRILGNPQDSLCVIHVAGTNGKGSVCRYLYCALEKAGYACGLYTSPYIEEFTERIQFHGSQISKDDLIRIGARVFEKARQMTERGWEAPTEFDVITAIAFVYFAEQKPDYVILEVGLGGRMDSTNVIRNPLAAVITSISKDHMDVLGDSLSQIAWEKAGIIKPKAPVIFAVKDKEASEVIFREAQEKTPPALLYDVFGTVAPACAESPQDVKKTLGGYCFTAQALNQVYPRLHLRMTGMHQVENAMCALSVLEALRKQGEFSDKGDEEWRAAVCAGMKEAGQPGRFELISQNPPVILDGAHNQDGVRALALSLKEHFGGKRILLVFGILKDKAAESMLGELRLLTREASVTVIATEPENPRRLAAKELAHKMNQKLGVSCCYQKDWKKAMRLAKEMAKDYDAVVFSGSLYLIGSIRGGWRKEYEKGIAGI